MSHPSSGPATVDAAGIVAASDPHVVVEMLARLQPLERADKFRKLPARFAFLVFRQLEATHQQELLEQLDAEQVRRLVEEIDPDDRARLLLEVSEPAAERLLAGLSAQERELTEQLLAHPQESAGRIMSPEYLTLQRAMTVDEALMHVRTFGREAETIDVLPVTDDDSRYAGIVALSDLVLAAPQERIEQLMNVDIRPVRADEDQESVARWIQSADLLAAPVVDDEGRLVGLVTVDDAMDVLDVEEWEDLSRTGAAEPLRRPYFSASIMRLARSRVLWLLMLAIAATLTVNVLNAFEQTLETIVALSLFIPLLIGVGGNAGAQSATTIVRAMAVDDVRFSDVTRVVSRETRVGLLLGSIVAVLGLLPVWWFVGRELAIVVCLTLVAICTLASLVGSFMPLLARRIGVDPAVVSAPFVTTIVDATGLLVYFLIAHAVMGI
jgi:magnesium transporter